MACGTPLMEHYKTQVPYALLVGVVTTIFGSLAVGLEWYPHYVGTIVSTFICGLFLVLFGQKVRPVGEDVTLFTKLMRRIKNRAVNSKGNLNERTPLTESK